MFVEGSGIFCGMEKQKFHVCFAFRVSLDLVNKPFWSKICLIMNFMFENKKEKKREKHDDEVN